MKTKPQKTLLQSVHADGAEARHKGLPAEANPYHFPEHSHLWDAWSAGWEGKDLPPEADTGLRVILGLAVGTAMALFFLLAVIEPKG